MGEINSKADFEQIGQEQFKLQLNDAGDKWVLTEGNTGRVLQEHASDQFYTAFYSAMSECGEESELVWFDHSGGRVDISFANMAFIDQLDD